MNIRIFLFVVGTLSIARDSSRTTLTVLSVGDKPKSGTIYSANGSRKDANRRSRPGDHRRGGRPRLQTRRQELSAYRIESMYES